MDATLNSVVANLSVEEKLQLIDGLWESLAGSVDKMPIPESHEAELERREQRIAEGKSTFSDWTEARERIFSAVRK